MSVITYTPYVAGMERTRSRPAPLKADRGLLGCPVCASCGRPYFPTICPDPVAPEKRDYLVGYRSPTCGRCVNVAVMRNSLKEGLQRQEVVA